MLPLDDCFTIISFAGLRARLGEDGGGRSSHECQCELIRTGNKDGHPSDPQGRYQDILCQASD